MKYLYSLIFLCVVMSPSRALSDEFTWTGRCGDNSWGTCCDRFENGEWHLFSNWNRPSSWPQCPQGPGLADTVNIPSGALVSVVNFLHGGMRVERVQATGDVVMNWGNGWNGFSVASIGDYWGQFAAQGGAFSGGTHLFHGAFVQSGGTQVESSRLENYGVASLTGSLWLGGSAVFANFGQMSLNNYSFFGSLFDGSPNSVGLFENHREGQMATTGDTTIYTSFNNSGTVNILNGMLRLDGHERTGAPEFKGVISGEINIAADGELIVQGPSNDERIFDNTVIRGPGRITLRSGRSHFINEPQIANLFTWNAPIQAGLDGGLLIDSALNTLVFTRFTGVAEKDNTIHLGSRAVSTIGWQGLELDNVSLVNDGELGLQSRLWLTNKSDINNSGRITSQPNSWEGRIGSSGTAVECEWQFNNMLYNTGEINLLATTLVDPIVVNEGVVTVDPSGHQTLATFNMLQNRGTISCKDGARLSLLDRGEQSSGGLELVNSTLTLRNVFKFLGGVVRGTGVVAGAGRVVNRGATLSPGNSLGRLEFRNSGLMQRANGRLAIEIGGRASGQYDQIVLGCTGTPVNATAAIDGELTVSLINGFTPSPGDSFPLIVSSCGQSDSVRGRFSRLLLPSMPVGQGMYLDYRPNGVTLGTIPVAGVSATRPARALGVGHRFDSRAIANPTDTDVTESAAWKSTAPEVASVVNGAVVGRRPGRATITVAFGGYSDSFDVGVVALATSASTALVSSVGTPAKVGNDTSNQPALSRDGRYAVFTSLADNLVQAGGEGRANIFLKDTINGTVSLISRDNGAVAGVGNSSRAAISSDGMKVAFYSKNHHLLSGPINCSGADVYNLYLLNLRTNTMQMLDLSPSGGLPTRWWGYSAAEAGEPSGPYDPPQLYPPALAGSGRCVAFQSNAENLTSDGAGGIFMRDLVSNTTELISRNPGGSPANGASSRPSVSADCRYVLFWSSASNLVSAPVGWGWNLFRYDRTNGVMEQVNLRTDGAPADGEWALPISAISGDGRYVTFRGCASNLIANDSNGRCDIFVRDMVTRTTQRVSVGARGQALGADSDQPAISADGRYVAFTTRAAGVVTGVPGGINQVYLRDLVTGQTTLASVDGAGAPSDRDTPANSLLSVSARGEAVAYAASSTRLAPNDSNQFDDVLLWRRGTSPTLSVAQ